jgi:hypothetical protein
MGRRAVRPVDEARPVRLVAVTGGPTFNPGEATKTVTIVVYGDSKKEANEYFYLDLFDESSNSLVTKSRGAGWILNH